MAVEAAGFDGVYIGGSTLATDLGLPDIGLVSLTEACQRGGAIADATGLATLIDVDTGFGEPINAARTIHELERQGLAGCHLEDQVNPKRCGHLANKALVDTGDMVLKLKAACAARRDPNFLIIARTDSRAVEGFEAAVERAEAYKAAGADMIFPEALADRDEFDRFRQAVSGPLLANMTEFGKSELLNASELEAMGYAIVIYPVTTHRLAMRAVEDGLRSILQHGHPGPPRRCHADPRTALRADSLRRLRALRRRRGGPLTS